MDNITTMAPTSVLPSHPTTRMQTGLGSLPMELVEVIAGHLCVGDLRNLRICSRGLEYFTFRIFYSKATMTFPLSASGLASLAKLERSEVRHSVEQMVFTKVDTRRHCMLLPDLPYKNLKNPSAKVVREFEKLVPLAEIERIMANLPKVTTLHITDDIEIAPWNTDLLRKGPFLPQIEKLNIQVSRTDSGSLTTLLAKSRNCLELRAEAVGPKRRDLSLNPLSTFMWSLEWLLGLRQNTMPNLRSLILYGGRMNLGHLSSILRWRRKTLWTIEITETVFCVDPSTISDLFDEVEESEVFESLKIKINIIDCEGSMCNVISRSEFRRWGSFERRGFKNWLEDRRGGARLYGWVSIQPERKLLPGHKVHFNRFLP